MVNKRLFKGIFLIFSILCASENGGDTQPFGDEEAEMEVRGLEVRVGAVVGPLGQRLRRQNERLNLLVVGVGLESAQRGFNRDREEANAKRRLKRKIRQVEVFQDTVWYPHLRDRLGRDIRNFRRRYGFLAERGLLLEYVREKHERDSYEDGTDESGDEAEFEAWAMQEERPIPRRLRVEDFFHD